MPPIPFRPLITVVRPSGDGRSVEVTLDLDGWIADASAPVEEGRALAAACRATCAAVTQLVPDGVVVSFAACELLEGEPWGGGMVLASVVLRHGDRPEEALLGAAWVRSDPQVAAVRATLDGLTRRLGAVVG